MWAIRLRSITSPQRFLQVSIAVTVLGQKSNRARGGCHREDLLWRRRRRLPDSDLDLLVKMDPGRSLLDLIALQQDLEDLLHCRVDVVTENGLSPYIRDRVLAEALPLTA